MCWDLSLKGCKYLEKKATGVRSLGAMCRRVAAVVHGQTTSVVSVAGKSQVASFTVLSGSKSAGQLLGRLAPLCICRMCFSWHMVFTEMKRRSDTRKGKYCNFHHHLFSLQDAASSCDAELLSLLLDAGLLVGCVSSALYPLLSSHMLSHQQEGGWDVEKAAAELLAAGHGPEAGSLLLAHRGTHQAQFTFNSALAVLKKWLWR